MTTPKLKTEQLILREIKGNDLFGYYEFLSDPVSMKLFGGAVLDNDIEKKDFVQRMKVEREQGISYFWVITLKEEKEFIGFVRLTSYNSSYFDSSYCEMGEQKYDEEFLKYIDRVHGWEIYYGLLKSQRHKGLMSEAISAIIAFCKSEKISPIYAKVNSITNIGTVKILKRNNFQNLMPLIDPNFWGKHEVKALIESDRYGMIYQWLA